MAQCFAEVLGDLVDELLGVEVFVAWWAVVAEDADGKILGHVTSLNGVDDNLLKSLAPVLEFLVAVELSTVVKSLGPCEDGGNRVGGGLAALLVDSEVTGNGTVSCFSLNGTAR